MDTLRKHCGEKRSHTVIEDNDPTGYKSNTAKAAKSELKTQAMEFPRYSPDLNPLDFSLWDAVEARVLGSAPRKPETVQAYKKRLRRIAMRLPVDLVRKAVGGIRARMQAVIAAKGHNVPKD